MIKVAILDDYQNVSQEFIELKKFKGDTVRGELFKAGDYDPGTSFKVAPDFKNSLPTWAGWEMEYPYEDYRVPKRCHAGFA